MLECELVNRTYKPGRSIAFVVQKPKIREIFAADFRDRVVHHLLYNYLSQKFEKIFSYDSWACRKGKGTHRAMFRLKHFVSEMKRERERERERARSARNIKTTSVFTFKLILGTSSLQSTTKSYLISFAKKLKTKRFFGFAKGSFFMTAPETLNLKFKALKHYLINYLQKNLYLPCLPAGACQSAT